MTNWNWKDDLHDHPTGQGRKQARLTTTNITISIVGGEGLYGDGVSTFEFGLKVGDDKWKVLGWNIDDSIDKLVTQALEIDEFLNKLD